MNEDIFTTEEYQLLRAFSQVNIWPLNCWVPEAEALASNQILIFFIIFPFFNIALVLGKHILTMMNVMNGMYKIYSLVWPELIGACVIYIILFYQKSHWKNHLKKVFLFVQNQNVHKNINQSDHFLEDMFHICSWPIRSGFANAGKSFWPIRFGFMSVFVINNKWVNQLALIFSYV